MRFCGLEPKMAATPSDSATPPSNSRTACRRKYKVTSACGPCMRKEARHEDGLKGQMAPSVKPAGANNSKIGAFDTLFCNTYLLQCYKLFNVSFYENRANDTLCQTNRSSDKHSLRVGTRCAGAIRLI